MDDKFLYKIKKTRITQKEAERSRLFNVFVIGLPRSGTSMITHICELLGVKMFYNSDSDKVMLDSLYKKRFGRQYHPNPSGFFEITKNFLDSFFSVASTPYSGCKLIAPVFGIREELLELLPCKVILVKRNFKEVVQSHEAFYGNKPDISLLMSAIATQIVNLKKKNIPFIEIDYNKVLQNPKYEINRIKKFINSRKTITQSLKFINKNLYRQRV